MNIYQAQDYQELHLRKCIADCQEAIVKFSECAQTDEGFVNEFQETDPSIAEIYRNWKVFHLEKVAYFQKRLEQLEQRARGS